MAEIIWIVTTVMAAAMAWKLVLLLDATNPLGPNFELQVGADGASAAEQIQAMVPRAHVVKIFNSTGFDNMRNPVYAGEATTMFYAGDDAGAKLTAGALATALGFDAIDSRGRIQGQHAYRRRYPGARARRPSAAARCERGRPEAPCD